MPNEPASWNVFLNEKFQLQRPAGLPFLFSSRSLLFPGTKTSPCEFGAIGTGLKSDIGTRSSVMLHNPIFIDSEDNQAIRREIGERLRLELGIELELPAGLKEKIDELCWLESSSIAPEAEQQFENKPEGSIPKLLADGAAGNSDVEYELSGLHHRYYGRAACP